MYETVPLTGDMLIRAYKTDAEVDLVCPVCGDYLSLMKTCYGWFAICRRNRKRWTWIRPDDYIMAERYAPQEMLHERAASGR